MVLELLLILFKLTACVWPVPVLEQAKITGTGHRYTVNLNKINDNSKTV